MRRLMLSALLISIAGLIAGCSATRGDFCDVSSAIYLSPGDDLSPDTKRAIVKHDDYGEQACGWKAAHG